MMKDREGVFDPFFQKEGFLISNPESQEVVLKLLGGYSSPD